MTAVLPDTDNAPTIQYVQRLFSDAVRRLCEPRVEWTGTKVETDPSLVDLCRQLLTAVSNRSGGSTIGSKIPARIDMLDLLVRIDSEAASYGIPGGTIEVFQAAAERDYGPEMVPTLQERTKRLERLISEARQLCDLNPTVLFLRDSRCPSCNAVSAMRKSGSECVRLAGALSVTASGDGFHAECHCCRASWSTEAEIAVFKKCVGLEGLV